VGHVVAARDSNCTSGYDTKLTYSLLDKADAQTGDWRSPTTGS